MLRAANHRVQVVDNYAGQSCDLMIALHAKRSAPAVARFADKYPDKPIVVAMTGTDLYGDLDRSQAAQRSLELATRLVLFQSHGVGVLPARFRDKTRVIYHSAQRPTRAARPRNGVFEVCVAGHLRPVKDPFRAALAARWLPEESKIVVTHLGAALSPTMGERAVAEMARNPRYRWHGDQPRWRTRQIIARSRLLVLASKMEGGPNVLSEALAASVPVVASRISGCLGLLGEDYPGLFDVGDTQQLAELMRRAEVDARFYRDLKTRCQRRYQLLTPNRERSALHDLVRQLVGKRS